MENILEKKRIKVQRFQLFMQNSYNLKFLILKFSILSDHENGTFIFILKQLPKHKGGFEGIKRFLLFSKVNFFYKKRSFVSEQVNYRLFS